MIECIKGSQLRMESVNLRGQYENIKVFLLPDVDCSMKISKVNISRVKCLEYLGKEEIPILK